MKKTLCIFVAALLTASCSDSPQQTTLRGALMEKLKDDSDLKDYKLAPEDVVECIMAQIADNVPGMPGDPRRDRYYEAYTKFIAVKSPADAQTAIEEYKEMFGSVKQAREAAMGVTDYIMSCIGGIIEKKAASQ